MGKIIDLKYGKSLPEKVRSGTGFPVYGSNGVVGWHEPPLTSSATIVIGRKGSVGEVNYSSVPCSPIDTTYYVDDVPGGVLRFWYYQLKSLGLGGLNKSTAIPGLSRSDAYLLDVKFPPVNEQRRIADKLDRVLARIDAANEHLSRVGSLLKRFRQVVLDSAVSGVLTADWRAKHGCQSGWPDVSLGGVLTDIRYGTSKKCFSEKKGVPVLRIPNVGEGGEVVVDELKYAEFDESELASFVLRRSDLLLIRSNGSPGLVGRSCLVGDAGAGFVFAGYLIRLRPNLDVVDPDFLNYVLRGTAVRRVVEGKVRSTSGVNNINTKELKSLRFLLPSIDEQQEIVRRVRLLMTSFDEIDQMSHSVARSVDLLSPSVLALAFSGGLVEQNPLDEPASELLARLAEAKASENHKPTRRKRQASA
jgi:type I restriction modification DNA specificity domain protein